MDFVIRRNDWRQCRFVTAELPSELPDGDVLFRVQRFALTANNVTYLLTGDALGYWSFFPAESGWGRVPVMGFGDVLRSAHPDVAEGERYFGFYPMSTHLVVQAEPNREGLVDRAEHREKTAPVYRQYTRASHDLLYSPEHEDCLMLLRGLFLTAFLADDYLADSDFFGARTVVVSSASSKTAIALAFQLARRRGIRKIGLTSARNRAFVLGLGLYDEVVLYDEVSSLEATGPAVFVDLAGDGAVAAAVHRRFGEQLVYSSIIGATHWGAGPRPEDLPGARPQLFFAPAQMQKRGADWGAAGLQQRLAAAWSAFRDSTTEWLRIERGWGPAAVESCYLEVLDGRLPASAGRVLSLWSEADEG